MNNIKDYFNERKKKGIHVGFSVDIRKVENFFKNLFGRKKKKENKDDKKRKNKDS